MPVYSTKVPSLARPEGSGASEQQISVLCTRVPVAADHADGPLAMPSSTMAHPVNSPSLKSSASNTAPVVSSSTSTSSKELPALASSYRAMGPLVTLASVTAKIWAPSIQTSRFAP